MHLWHYFCANFKALINLRFNNFKFKEMIPETKLNKKNKKVHRQVITGVWVRSSKNSGRLFQMIIMDIASPEIIYSGAMPFGPQKSNENIFVLFANVISGDSTNHSANNDLVAEHYIKLTVNWRGMSAGKKILDAKTKLDKLTDNADFVSPFSPEFISLATFASDISDADAKILSRSKKEANSARSLYVALKLLYKDCKNLGTMIQLKMDSCAPDEAIRMCLAAGYTFKAIKVRGPRKNSVKKTTEPGVVQVEGEGRGGRTWQFSLDPFNGSEIINLEYTTGGVTTYNVGQSRVDAWFRWRLKLTRGRHGDWSEWYKGETP
jgi:hypothetical protein